MDYYEIDSRKYSFAECWRLGPAAVPFTWAMKILGRRIDFAQAIPYPTRIDRLDGADIPAEHAAWLRARIARPSPSPRARPTPTATPASNQL